MTEKPDLSAGGRSIMLTAKRLARDFRHDFITTEHVLLSIFEYDKQPESVRIISEIHGIDVDEFRTFIISNMSKYKGPKQPPLDEIEPSGRVLKMLTYASSISHEMSSINVNIDHIMLSILVSDSGSGNNLFKLKNIDVDTLYEDIYSRIINVQKKGKRKTKQKMSTGSTGDEVDQIVDHSESVLEKYAVNLTRQALLGELDPVIGREQDVYYLLEVLSRRTKNNPVLIGEPGVGKTAVVELLAQMIVMESVPVNLMNKQIYSIDLAQLVAGTIYRGQFEERIKEVINYVQQQNNIILFIDELHMLVGAGSTSGSMDASNILKPALARGKLSCIGATTIQEYKEYIEGDGALERRFQSITIDEPCLQDTIDILKGVKKKYEEYHNVRYTNSVLSEIVRLTDRYITDKKFPDKAIDVLDEIGARIKVRKLQPSDVQSILVDIEEVVNLKNKSVEKHNFDLALGYRETEYELIEQLNSCLAEREHLITNPTKATTVQIENVRSLISDRTGVPMTSLEQHESKTLKELATKMKKLVIGQDESIDKMCSAIKRSRAGISDPNKPICSFLFLGPTGVGKTHLARTLGEQMFHNGNFKQFDMSEFGERHTTSKLIGSPPGYVGYGQGGELTEYVRYNPYCVLLFDEIEKAHPDVLQLFLQIFEYGCLTDGDGMEVNFKNTIIVMTSNIGAHKFDKLNSVGFGTNNNVEEGVIEELKKMYAPEFLNRLDETIVFTRLKQNEVYIICELLLKSLKKNARTNSGCLVTYDKAVVSHLVNMNEQTEYGARPLKRIITKHIENQLAELIIDSETRIKKVHISVVDDGLSFVQTF